ncbi:unnamed protein product [Protopolystoma xenopodis]|uniref:Conserved oligomeric Golgi complex subunit 3 C-terminal domain-containing protein n=1 Tax=Protopolystoma xenopodis TaxID=117903 RepID=A0A3S5B0W4_9PLAT|nr:unnamed protein product [Protopolystoma xenopodis]
MRSQILGYVPSLGDLSYPEKLELMNSIASELPSKVAQPCHSLPDSILTSSDHTSSDINVPLNSKMLLSPADMHGMWYPTVRRTLVCLSKLSRCLDVDSFRGLAHDCLALCIQSLVQAASQIEANRNPIDGQLFLIKHLLILREQMVPFNVEFSVNETSLDINKLKCKYGSIYVFSLNLMAIHSSYTLKLLQYKCGFSLIVT